MADAAVRRARRVLRWLWPAAAVTAAVAIVAVGAAALAPAPAPRAVSAAAASDGYLDWPARGTDLDDAALLQTANDLWDGRYNNPTRAVMRPHHDVRPLFAQRYPDGSFVVLQGADELGHRSVVVIFISAARPWGIPAWGRVTTDLPADPAAVSEVSATFVINSADSVNHRQVFVLGDPATTSVTIEPAGSAAGRVIGTNVGRGVPPDEGDWTITTYHGDAVAYRGADDGFQTVVTYRTAPE